MEISAKTFFRRGYTALTQPKRATRLLLKKMTTLALRKSVIKRSANALLHFTPGIKDKLKRLVDTPPPPKPKPKSTPPQDILELFQKEVSAWRKKS